MLLLPCDDTTQLYLLNALCLVLVFGQLITAFDLISYSTGSTDLKDFKSSQGKLPRSLNRHSLP